MKFDMDHALCSEKKSYMYPSKAGGQCTFWKILAYLCTLFKEIFLHLSHCSAKI